MTKIFMVEMKIQVAVSAEDEDSAYALAVEYLDRIGESQPHYRDGSVGKLHKCNVSTEINHQRYSSETNYHRHLEFDITGK